MYRLSIPAVFLLLVFASAPVFGNDYVRPTSIAVATIPLESEESSSVGSIVSNAATLQLRLRGFSVTEIEGDPKPRSVEDADYLLTSQYALLDGKLSVIMTVFDTDSGKEAAETEWTGQLDLDTDDGIQSAVASGIIPAIPAGIEVTRRQTEKAAENGEEWAEEALSSDSAGDNGSTDSSQADENASGTGSWVLEIGGLAFIPLTDTASYSEIGAGGRMALGYAFNAKSVRIAPRLIISGMWIPTDTMANIDLLLLPFGLDIKLSAAAPVMAPYLRVGGGVTWLMLLPENGAVDGIIIPFAEAAVGLDFFFGKTFGLTLDVAFSVQFESSVILYGIVPALGLGFRF